MIAYVVALRETAGVGISFTTIRMLIRPRAMAGSTTAESTRSPSSPHRSKGELRLTFPALASYRPIEIELPGTDDTGKPVQVTLVQLQ